LTVIEPKHDLLRRSWLRFGGGNCNKICGQLVNDVRMLVNTGNSVVFIYLHQN